MSTEVKLFCSSLVLSLMIILPATVPAESAILGHERANKLFEQIQDLELMQRNLEACYHAEAGTPIAKSLSRLSLTNPEGLDGALINRVFGYLVGTPEYDRFIKAYRALIQRSDYGRLHADELFAEYKRLLESGRIRFSTQLKEWQESLAEKCSPPVQEGVTQAIPVKSVTIGHTEELQRTEGGRVVLPTRVLVRISLGGSAPPAADRINVSTIVVSGLDQSDSAGAAAPTIDMVELHILVAQERVVPLEKVSIGRRHDLVKGGRSGSHTDPQLSDAGEKGVAAWDQ
jgi:hypothetical protein